MVGGKKRKCGDFSKKNVKNDIVFGVRFADSKYKSIDPYKKGVVMLFKKVNVVKSSSVATGSLAEAKKQVKKEGYYTMPKDGCLSVNQYYSILKRLKKNLKVEYASKELENQFYGFNTLNQALKNVGLKGYVVKIMKNTEKYVDFVFKFSKLLNEKNEYVSCVCNARYSIDDKGNEHIDEIKK